MAGLRVLLALCGTALVLSVGCSGGAGDDDSASAGSDDGAGTGGNAAGGRAGGAAAGRGGSSMACIPGSTELCTGPNGCRGGRTCERDGSRYSACDCGASAGGSGTAGSGPVAGAAGIGAAAGNATVTGGASGTSAMGGSGDASGSGGMGGSDMRPPVPICTASCDTAADCGSGFPADDADNYRCDGGACVPTGCASDLECDSQTPGMLCRPVPGLNRSACVKGCSAPTDCATASAAYDTDNYRCTDGACEYAGCNNDDECAGLYPGMNPACADTVTGIRTCTPRCEVPDDCSLGVPASDADNYRCENNLCVYLGCRGAAECAPVFDVCLGL